MKTRNLVMFMGVWVVVAQAAVRQPVGIWDFTSNDPNSVTLGVPLTLVGSVQPAEGVLPGDGAVQIGVGSHFICQHGISANGGGEKVNEWTLLVDFRYPDTSVGKYVDIFQTDPANSDDSDWTVAASNGAVGISAVGYSSQTGFYTAPDTWYRMVMPVDNGTRHDLFMDGIQVVNGKEQGIDGRFSLTDILLLFAANDGDDNDIYVTKVAIWDVPLTAGEIMALGDPNDSLYQDNAAPDVYAGADQEVEMDEGGSILIALDGTVVDEGAVTVAWTQISGPEMVAIDDPASEDTTATITAPGKYILQLLADDGQYQMTDTVTFVVHPNNYGGLIVHWDFEQEWDGLTVQDVSSHENHGQVIDGATGQALYIAEGTIGQALDLQNGDYTAGGDCIAMDMVMPNSGTIALWYKPHALYNYNAVFDNSVQADDWEMWVYVDGRVRFRVEGGTEVTADLAQLAQGQNVTDLWWHITVTWARLEDSQTVTEMYINGFRTDRKESTAWVNPGATFYLGGGNPGNDFAHAVVDDFRLYDRVLPAKDVLELVYGENVPPVVDAGPDQEFEMDEASTPIVVTLDGTVSDIGETLVMWSKIAGPNDITFENPQAEDTTATISAPGRYTLQCMADDGEYTSADTLIIIVYPYGYNGQIVHWDFQTISGSQITDASGNWNHGTIIDGPDGTIQYTDGKIGQGVNLLNGDYTTGGDHIALEMRLPDNGTFALWYNPHAIYDYNTIFDNSRDADDWEMWIYSDGRMRFRVDKIDDTNFAEVTAFLHDIAPDGDARGDWFHVAVTWQRLSETTVALKMFVNANLVDEITGPWIDPGEFFYLGGGNAGNDYAQGLADELFIYNRPLERSEILGLMYLGNKPPIVDAGPDMVKWLDASEQLDLALQGSVINDGGPADLMIEWTVISGPNDITIHDPAQPDTFITIYHPGVYNLQIDANDGEFSVVDDLFIEVYPDGYTGLIVDWSFDADSLQDFSGEGNDGTFIDGPAAEAGYVKGKSGRAWRPGNGDFPTGGDYVSLNLTLPEAGTIAFWYQVNNLYNYASLYDNSLQQDDWEMWIYGDGRLRGRIEAGGEVTANLHALSSDGDARGDWFHIAYTWKRLSPTTVQNSLYVDGQLIQSRVGPWIDPGSTFYLGGGNDGNDYGDGIWDEVRLYERALTTTEIRLLASLSNFDEDFDVDIDDLLWIMEGWLETMPDCVFTPTADYNMDCRIDMQDLAVFAAWWLESLE